jgi:hypothetical protein
LNFVKRYSNYADATALLPLTNDVCVLPTSIYVNVSSKKLMANQKVVLHYILQILGMSF